MRRNRNGQIPSYRSPGSVLLTTARFVVSAASIILALGIAVPGMAQTSAVELTGNPSPSGLSGFPGSKFTLGDPNSTTRALVGVLSRERSDNPCFVSVGWEDVNQFGSNDAVTKDLCGPKGASSGTMGATYANTGGLANRVFITGAQVCMNKADDRVKGIHLHGQRITDAGALVDFGPDAQDARTNCHQDHWKRWVSCPVGQIATAAIMHFEAGNTPRSWTGIELKCRGLRVTGTISTNPANTGGSSTALAEVIDCTATQEKDIRAVAWNIADDWRNFASSVENVTGKNIGSCIEKRFSENGKVQCETVDKCTKKGCRQGHSFPGKAEIKIYPDFLNRIENYAQADRRACYAAVLAHEFTHTCWFAESRPEAREDAAFAYWQQRFPGTSGFNINNPTNGCGLD